MLRCRREDLEKVNKLFGTEITVEFDSAWANNIKEIDLRMAQMANEASQLVEESIEEPQTEETPIEEEPQEVDEEPQEVEEESEVNEEEPVEEKGDDEDVAGSSDKDSDTTE